MNDCTLYLVGTSIGNPTDISLRAIELLKAPGILLCEERKTASKLYKFLNIPFPVHFLVNEHTSNSEITEIFQKIREVKKAVLISDAGMPAFCDPGQGFIEKIRTMGAIVRAVPGPTALTTALSLLGIGNRPFYFAGFPPRVTSERELFFRSLTSCKLPVILYETPYRLEKLILEIKKVFPAQKKVAIFVNLTEEKEQQIFSTIRDLNPLMINEGPPVIVLYDDQPEKKGKI